MTPDTAGTTLLRVPDHEKLIEAYRHAFDPEGEPRWGSPALALLRNMRRFYTLHEIAEITGGDFTLIRTATSPDLRNHPGTVRLLQQAHRAFRESDTPRVRRDLDLLIGNAREKGWSLRAIGTAIGVHHPEQVRLLNPSGPTRERSFTYGEVEPRPGHVTQVPRSMRADSEGRRLTSRHLTDHERRALRTVGAQVRAEVPGAETDLAVLAASIRDDSGQGYRHLSRVAGLSDSRAETLVKALGVGVG